MSQNIDTRIVKLNQRRQIALAKQENRKNNLKVYLEPLIFSESTENLYQQTESKPVKSTQIEDTQNIKKSKKKRKSKSNNKTIEIDEIDQDFYTQNTVLTKPKRLDCTFQTPEPEKPKPKIESIDLFDDSESEEEIKLEKTISTSNSVANSKSSTLKSSNEQRHEVKSTSSFINKIAVVTPSTYGLNTIEDLQTGLPILNPLTFTTPVKRCQVDSPTTLRTSYQQTKNLSNDKSRFSFLPGMEHVETIKQFIFEPAACAFKDQSVRARITREKRTKGMNVNDGVKYFLHLENPNDDNNSRCFIMAARKQNFKKLSTYLISTDTENINKNSPHIIGKLRSNMLGTKFVAFDNGVSSNSPIGMKNLTKIRQEFCMITYEPNILGFHGPRKMTLVLPAMEEDKSRKIWRPLSVNDSISSKFEQNDDTDLIVLQNKKPIWNEDSNSFVLNFNGRVTMASVKNFQIIHKDDPHYLIMQFGRISEDVFTIDWRYPLCAFQAFVIALSSFDSKLACE